METLRKIISGRDKLKRKPRLLPELLNVGQRIELCGGIQRSQTKSNIYNLY